MASKREYNEDESRRTEKAYLSPEIQRQRERTLEVLNARAGEYIIDVGCGPGLLAKELAAAVGDTGRIIGIDSSAPMIRLAENRCSGLSNVELINCDATALTIEDAIADALCCVQVLLYVPDVDKALEEIQRVLKPGGRIVILETDWRSTVLHSHDEALTEKIIEAWDRAVASPRLPARLGPLLREKGFGSVQVEAVPLVSNDCKPDGFSMTMIQQSAQAAIEQGIITEAQGRAWLEELTRLGTEGAYFFCVNRFLFSAQKS